MTDDFHLVVHACEGAVAHPKLRPDQDAVEMGAEHARELLERREAAVARPPEPLQEMAARPRRAAIRPEAAEILLEEVRLDDRAVDPQQRPQPRAFVLGEVLGILDPQETSTLEARLVDPVELTQPPTVHVIA